MKLPSFRSAVLTLIVTLSVGLPRTTFAADPYEINVILGLTGSGTLSGQDQLQAIQIAEGVINKGGGIDGRPVKFVFKDDQSNPQVSIQLMQGMIAAKVPVVLGPTNTAMCNAVMPLVAASGPVTYCFTPGANPSAGGYVFSALTTTPDQIAVAVRYFRERGWKKLAYIVTTDASGLDVEKGLLAAVALPENRGVEIVDGEHFAPSDLSVSAQLAKIKGAKPDALLAWATGTPGGTVLHGLHDADYVLPVLLSAANNAAPFTKQFGSFLNDQMYVPGMAYYGGTTNVDAKTRAAMNQLTAAYKAANAGIPDQNTISAWDPTMFLVDILRRVGPDASPGKIRDAMIASKGWVGVNGAYDFTQHPQRGLGDAAILITHWDPAKNDYVAVSKLGGAPLR